MTRSDATIRRRWDLVLPHAERLRRLVRGQMGNSVDVDDCVQEAMLRTVSFANLDEGRVAAFLTATVQRLCVDRHRERERQLRLQRRLAVAEGTSTPEEVICEHHLGRWLLTQAMSLPDRERQVVLARARGLSTVDAARHHNISVKAAESAFTRARTRLRNLCEAAGPEPVTR